MDRDGVALLEIGGDILGIFPPGHNVEKDGMVLVLTVKGDGIVQYRAPAACGPQFHFSGESSFSMRIESHRFTLPLKMPLPASCPGPHWLQVPYSAIP